MLPSVHLHQAIRKRSSNLRKHKKGRSDFSELRPAVVGTYQP